MANNPMNNPIPLIIILLLLKNRSGFQVPMYNSLQLDSLLDNVHMMLHAWEKLNGMDLSNLASSLPDMKKMLEAVDKIPF